MSPGRTQPVSRGRVAVFGLAAIAVVVGLVAGLEQLRHPHPVGGPVENTLTEPGGDPRIPVRCPEPPPREDEPAEDTEESPPEPPAGPVTSSELYDCPTNFDGRVVRYRGEAVGAILRRADGAWLQLNDDVYAGDAGPLPAHRDFRGGNAGVGVFVPHDVADQIVWVGGPRARGDILEVVGRFYRVDASSEVAVIHVTTGEVVENGFGRTEEPLVGRQVAALSAALVAMALLTVQIRRARRLP